MMKLKSLAGLFMLVILYFPSGEVYAQRPNKLKKTKKVVVVRKTRPYAGAPIRGRRVTSIPTGAVNLRWNSQAYYYRNGAFYRAMGKGYVVVSAPIGIRVRTLPIGFSKMRIRNRNVFYYNGTYYSKTESNEYEIINPPVGAKVGDLPEGTEQVSIDERTYYRMDDVYYKAIVSESGEVQYQVVEMDI